MNLPGLFVSRSLVPVFAVVIAASAQAATYNWIQTTPATYNWNANTNWNPSTNGFPNAAGDVANVNNDIATDTHTINLNVPITVGTLGIGDANGARSFVIANNGGSLTFATTTGDALIVKTNGNSGGTVADDIQATLTLKTNLDLNNTSPNGLNISGIIGENGGARSITKLGSGTVTLSGANTYSGNTTITGGALGISTDAALGNTTNVVINGGTLLVSADMDLKARPIRIGPDGNGTINVAGGATVTYANIIRDNGGAGNFVKNGGGTLILFATNTYSGTTTVSGGTLQINDGGWLGPNSATVAVNGGTLAFNRADNLDLNNQFTGGGTVAQIAGSTLTLSGANANTANASALGGILNLGKTVAAACNNLTVNGGTAVITGTGDDQISGNIMFNGGVLDLNGHNETVGSLTANNVPVATLKNSVASNNVVITGSFNINSPSEFIMDVASGGSLQLTSSGTPSAINGNFLHVTGGGTLILALQSPADANNANWTIDSGSTLQDGDGGMGVGMAGTIANSGILDFNSANSFTISGPISGSGPVIQHGSGTTTLSSGGNSYSGNTTITAGTLALSGGGFIVSSPLVSIASGAVFNVSAKGAGGYTIADGQTVSGNGTVTGSLNGNPNTQILAGGANTAGTLTVGGRLAFNSGFTPQFDLADTPGGAGDLLQVNGNLVLNSNTITINLLNGTIAPGTYRLINYTGSRAGTLNATAVFNPPGPVGFISTITTNQVNLVIPAATGPVITTQRNGNALSISWTDPTFHLQAQTNGLNVGISTNWANYPGGATSPVAVPISTANGTVFLRLISP